MKKSIVKNDEIDLGNIIKVIWNEKVKVILAIFMSVMIAFIYNYLKPNIFQISIEIKENKPFEFTKFKSLQNFLYEDEISLNKELTINMINETNMLKRFMDEFVDYDEIIQVLKNNNKIKKNISSLSNNDQIEKLYNLSQSFSSSAIKSNIGKVGYNIKLNWLDPNEGKDILKKVVSLTHASLKKSVYKELIELLEGKKNFRINEDLKKIHILREQSLIARELEITNNQMDNFNINDKPTSYLRGYLAIEKEISLILSRQYNDLDFYEKEIKNLQKSDSKLVDYNFFLIKTKSTKNNQIIYFSILFGLIIGSFFVLVQDLLNSKKFYKYNKSS